MKLRTILTSAALGLAFVATPAIAQTAVPQADRVSAADSNNKAIIFRDGDTFFTPDALARELADRDNQNNS
ncbi:MAG: hypothetical protein AAF141_07480 [Pseudomonadota bacterium]